MDIPAYVLAWLLYVVAATGLIIILWRMTKNGRLPRTRRVLRVLGAAILFTPVNIADQGLWLAPAYLSGAYDWAVGNHERALLAALSLSGAFCILLLMVMLESLVRRLLHMAPQA